MALLDYLVRRFPYCDADEWARRIAAGLVRVEGGADGDAEVLALPGQLLRPGQKVTSRVDHREPDLPEEVERIRLDRAAGIGILGKCAGVPVTRTGEVVYNTFVQQARRTLDNPEVRLLHRLDRETSGLILCALDKGALRFQQRLECLLRRKFYLVVVRGTPSWQRNDCRAPLRESASHVVRAAMEVHPEGKACRTTFVRVASGTWRGQEASLLLAELHTGRKHQIRAHLAYLGHPVVGDKVYAHGGRYYLKRMEEGLDEADLEILGTENHLLHSWAAEVALPLSCGEDEGDDEALGLPESAIAANWRPEEEAFAAPELFRSGLFSPDFRCFLDSLAGWEAAAEAALQWARTPDAFPPA